jgi:hypothetical protein
MNSCETRYYVLMQLRLLAVKDVTRLPLAQDRRVVERPRIPVVVYIKYTYKNSNK